MSRYHQVPRDSMESEDREAREFLIPSPVSNVLSVSGLPATRSCSFRPSIYLRIFSSVCALVGLLVGTSLPRQLPIYPSLTWTSHYQSTIRPSPDLNGCLLWLDHSHQHH